MKITDQNLELDATPGSNAGTSPTIIVTGGNSYGEIEVTPGADPNGEAICDISFFDTPYVDSNKIVVLLTPMNAEAARLNAYATSRTDSGFRIESESHPTSKALWAYNVAEILPAAWQIVSADTYTSKAECQEQIEVLSGTNPDEFVGPRPRKPHP